MGPEHVERRAGYQTSTLYIALVPRFAQPADPKLAIYGVTAVRWARNQRRPRGRENLRGRQTSEV